MRNTPNRGGIFSVDRRGHLVADDALPEATTPTAAPPIAPSKPAAKRAAAKKSTSKKK
jgi:hypothetical protein